MKKLAPLMLGLVSLSACGSTGDPYTKKFTVGEMMARCTLQFCQVFNSTQVGRESGKAAQVTVFVPGDNYFPAYLTAGRITLESLLGTAEGEALVKAHTTLQALPSSYSEVTRGVTLWALDGRSLEFKADNTIGTEYSIAGIPVFIAPTESGSGIKNGNIIEIEGSFSRLIFAAMTLLLRHIMVLVADAIPLAPVYSRVSFRSSIPV